MGKTTGLFAIIMILVLTAFSAPVEAAAQPQETVPEPLPLLSRPDADKGPTKVYGAMWLIDVDSIDSSAQNFVANVFVMFRWKDPRLAYTRNEKRTFRLDQVWNPMIQIANEIGLVRRTLPEIVDVEPDGTVTYRQRFVGPFSQPLKLNDFPFDTQTFRLHIVSPGSTPSDIQFMKDPKWIEKGLSKASGIAENISLPDWKIIDFNVKNVPYEVAPNIQTAGFAFDFVAKRDIRHYLWKVILPLILIVMMSWSVFWIDPSNAGTQIAVATTSMLTLIAYRFAIDSQVPRVPYMTRLDQFIVVGTVLVFLTLMQVVLTAKLAQTGKDTLAKKLDRLSRWIFPIVFVVSLIAAISL